MLGNEKSRINETLTYRDFYVSVFVDEQKYLIVFLNDMGQTKVINFDSNFYCVEDDIIAYRDIIEHSSASKDEQYEFLRDFIIFVQKELDGTNDKLNWEYLEHNGIKHKGE